MDKYQLFLITFHYRNAKCFLPRIFKFDYWTKDKKMDFCQKVIDKLQEDSEVKNLYIYPGISGTMEYVYNDFLNILNAPNPKVQYLRIEDRKLYDKKFFQEVNQEFYTKMQIKNEVFPIRVVDTETGKDMDEPILPLVIIEEPTE